MSEQIAPQKTLIKRRGRPRKHPVEVTPCVHPEKPREERSFEEFFPDLNIKEPLNLVNLKQPLLVLPTDLSSADSFSIDECETASEGEERPILPLPSFKKLDQLKIKPGTVFQRPENHYIHYQALSEAEMFELVEYDMDEQDQKWLRILNKERKKQKLGEVSDLLFETIIDNLEKEWFNLVKHLPKKIEDSISVTDDSTCAVCDDGECENSNAIVFCDGCNLAVHQDCYGIPYIPEGQWLCRQCMVSPEKPVSCIFCPFEGGAFKQTNSNQWCHLLCAIWIPEVSIANSVYMEPIEHIERIPKSRWKLNCYICRRRQGACIQCDNKQCFTAFHPTCARWARLCMRHPDGFSLKAYCERHTPQDYKKEVDVDDMVNRAQQWFLTKESMPRERYIDEEEEVEGNERQQAVNKLLPTTKAANGNQHLYSSNLPIAPDFILEKLEKLPCVQQAKGLQNKSSLITSICRYWSLKRGSRRGAPLLKRLHLELWTSESHQKQTKIEQAQKTAALRNLRTNLEKFRILSEMIQKREGQKLEILKKKKSNLEAVLYPIEKVIKPIIHRLIAMDKAEVFRYPVTVDIAPDYFEFIKEPMSFMDVLNKLTAHQYLTLEDFEHDMSLIWSNCMTYNKPDTAYYKEAQVLKAKMYELLRNARDSLNVSLGIKNSSTTVNSCTSECTTEAILNEEKGGSKINHINVRATTKKLLVVDNKKTKQEVETTSKQKKAEKHLSNVKGETKAKITSTKTSVKKGDEKNNDMNNQETPTLVNNSKSDDKNSEIPSLVDTIRESDDDSSRQKLPSQPLVDKSQENTVQENDAVDKPEARPVGRKRRRSPQPEVESMKMKKLTRITRSARNQNQRVLRSRSIRIYQAISDTEKTSTKVKETIVHMKENKIPGAQKIADPSISIDVPPPKIKFVDGEIIWARVPRFPSHPAKIVSPASRTETIPADILLAKPKENRQIILVKFYLVGDRHTWSWVHKEDTNPFGYPKVDQEMLLQAKKTNKKHRIQEVKRAYQHVCDSLGINAKIALSQVFQRR